MRQALTVLSLGLLTPITKEPLRTCPGNFSVLGSSLVLTLEQAEGNVSGRGFYAFEAGHAGSLEVTGTYKRPGIGLVLHYDFGQTLSYAGTFQDAQHLSGVLADSRGHGEPFMFTRR